MVAFVLADPDVKPPTDAMSHCKVQTVHKMNVLTSQAARNVYVCIHMAAQVCISRAIANTLKPTSAGMMDRKRHTVCCVRCPSSIHNRVSLC